MSLMASFLNSSFLLKTVTALHGLLEFSLKRTGLYDRGYRNVLKLKLTAHELFSPRLPVFFDGFRILFLSDLHFGEIKELAQVVAETIKDVEADLCLFGGDFRFAKWHPDLPFLDETRKVVSAIRTGMGVYGVLGNHDTHQMMEVLEKAGIKILVNESTAIYREGQSIQLIGVDDPASQGRADGNKAFRDVPAGAFKLVLAHSPDFYDEAAERGGDMYLCGHTHNGQIRLPWYGAFFTATTAPRHCVGGLWRHKNMTGFTVAGIGATGISVRFLCPPEVAVLTLRSGVSNTQER